MNAAAARLLVALTPRELIDQVLADLLPAVGWRYAAQATPEDLGSIEAMLVGSLQRELGDFHPSRTPQLAFVQGVYTGLDGFPFDRFPESVRIAGNVGGYAPFVAEHAVALALASARSLVLAQRTVAEGRLRPAPDQLSLRGTTALILGYGAIGREIAARLEGFGVRCVGMTRSGRMAPGLAGAFPADRIDEALAEADLVFDVRPLTRATRGSIGAPQFARFRTHAIYVNVGRAGTVDEEALYRHLSSHPSFRAAMDPWWSEDFAAGRLGQRFPWTELPNFVGTPHCASDVPGAEEFTLRRAVENLARFFSGGAPSFVADRREYEE